MDQPAPVIEWPHTTSKYIQNHEHIVGISVFDAPPDCVAIYYEYDDKTRFPARIIDMRTEAKLLSLWMTRFPVVQDRRAALTNTD